MRMLSAAGNPRANNLMEIIGYLQQVGVRFNVGRLSGRAKPA